MILQQRKLYFREYDRNKKIKGSFTGSVYSNYTHRSLSAYKLIFDCIFYPNETEKHLSFLKK